MKNFIVRNSSLNISPPACYNIISPSLHKWENGGKFDFEIIGETYYQNNLRRLTGSLGRVQCEALLSPIASNPFDDKAVAVDIAGYQVGYLSREDAQILRRRLSDKKLDGQVTTTAAVIRGGGCETEYRVWLDMERFD